MRGAILNNPQPSGVILQVNAVSAGQKARVTGMMGIVIGSLNHFVECPDSRLWIAVVRKKMQVSEKVDVLLGDFSVAQVHHQSEEKCQKQEFMLVVGDSRELRRRMLSSKCIKPRAPPLKSLVSLPALLCMSMRHCANGICVI